MGSFISSVSAIIVGPFIYKNITNIQNSNTELIITKENSDLWNYLTLSLHTSTNLLHTQKHSIITQNNKTLFLPTDKYYNIDIDNHSLPIKAITDNNHSITAFKIIANTDNLHIIQLLIPSFQYKIPKEHRTCKCN